MDEYFAANRARWDELAPQHARSAYYDVEAFKAGESSLRSIEREELGDVRDKSLLHLQCHFGLDTLSWARLGARVTGVDFSPASIEIARSLSAELDIPADFVCSNVYDLPDALDARFDIVFTSYGALVWLPDLPGWADVVARFLEPGGVFYIVELHPIVEAMDTESPELRFAHSYFHTGSPIRSGPSASYAGPDARSTGDGYEWQHSLADVVNALVDAGLAIQWLHEFPMSSWRSSPVLERGSDGWWRWPPNLPELPLVYSIKAKRLAS